jgi:hypothetical protein
MKFFLLSALLVAAVHCRPQDTPQCGSVDIACEQDQVLKHDDESQQCVCVDFKDAKQLDVDVDVPTETKPAHKPGATKPGFKPKPAVKPEVVKPEVVKPEEDVAEDVADEVEDRRRRQAENPFQSQQGQDQFGNPDQEVQEFPQGQQGFGAPPQVPAGNSQSFDRRRRQSEDEQGQFGGQNQPQQQVGEQPLPVAVPNPVPVGIPPNVGSNERRRRQSEDEKKEEDVKKGEDVKKKDVNNDVPQLAVDPVDVIKPVEQQPPIILPHVEGEVVRKPADQQTPVTLPHAEVKPVDPQGPVTIPAGVEGAVTRKPVDQQTPVPLPAGEGEVAVKPVDNDSDVDHKKRQPVQADKEDGEKSSESEDLEAGKPVTIPGKKNRRQAPRYPAGNQSPFGQPQDQESEQVHQQHQFQGQQFDHDQGANVGAQERQDEFDPVPGTLAGQQQGGEDGQGGQGSSTAEQFLSGTDTGFQLAQDAGNPTRKRRQSDSFNQEQNIQYPVEEAKQFDQNPENVDAFHREDVVVPAPASATDELFPSGVPSPDPNNFATLARKRRQSDDDDDDDDASQQEGLGQDEEGHDGEDVKNKERRKQRQSEVPPPVIAQEFPETGPVVGQQHPPQQQKPGEKEQSSEEK